MNRVIAAVLFVLTCVNAANGMLRDTPPRTSHKELQGDPLDKIVNDINAIQADNAELKNGMAILQKELKSLQKENMEVKNEMASFRMKETVLTTKVVGLEIESKSLKKENMDIRNKMAINALIMSQTKIDNGKLQVDVTNFNSMFNCAYDQCTASISKYFVFPKGVIVGKRNSDCIYGDAILSVDDLGGSCPSGDGSVTFGSRNTASGDYSTVTGGHLNKAAEDYATVIGGIHNIASGYFSFAAGGMFTTASGVKATAVGGHGVTAASDESSQWGKTFKAQLQTHSSGPTSNLDEMDEA